MKSRSVTNRTYTTRLIDGKPDGIRLYQFKGHPMDTLVIPRDYVAEAKELPDIPMRGVYYLLSIKNGKPSRIYAGQTVQGIGRLENHLSAKSWWKLAVMFLASDRDFSKDVIDGLEAVMIRHARQYGFCTVDNEVEPRPHVSPYDEELVYKTHKEILWRMDVLRFGFYSENGLPRKDEAVSDSKPDRNPPFNFKELGISVGAEIEFYDAKQGKPRPDIKAKVCSPRRVRFRGKVMSLSDAAKRVLKKKGSLRGTEYWTYNGIRLIDIYREKYPLK